MTLLLLSSNVLQQQQQQQQKQVISNQQQLISYRLVKRSHRKCLPLIIQGNKTCGSCGGKR